MTTIENVVFTYRPDADPAIRYRCIRSSCTGSADTLAQARSRYRAELSSVLQVERRQLPPVVEHVQTVVHGMWVRERIGSVHRDHAADRMFLQTLLAPGDAQAEIRAYVGETSTAGVEPVIVLADADDPVATVLDQMTAQDAVIVTYPDASAGVGWAAIHGSQVDGADEIPPVPADPAIREMTLQTFAQNVIAQGHRRAVRVDPYPLSEAC